MTSIKGGLLTLFCVSVIGCGGQAATVAPGKMAALQRGATQAEAKRQLGQQGELLFRVMCGDQRVDAFHLDVSPGGKGYLLIFANARLWRIVERPVFYISAESDPSRAADPFYILDRVQRILDEPDVAKPSSSPAPTDTRPGEPDEVPGMVAAHLPMLVAGAPIWIPLMAGGAADNARYEASGVWLGDVEAKCDKRLGPAVRTWTAPDGATWKRYQAAYMSMLFSTNANFLTVRFIDGRAVGVFQFEMLDDTDGGKRDQLPAPR